MRPTPRTPLSLAWAAVVAAIGGATNAGAFPALGWWPLIFLGTGLMLWSFRGRTVWGSLLVGLIAGFAFFGTHIFWLTVYLGAIPWLALAGLETVFFAIGAVLLSLAWRVLPLVWSSRTGRLIGTPPVLAGLWTLREAITSVWPYGGFSWGRLSFSQSDSPFGTLVSWVGASGLSFILAWISALTLMVLLEVHMDWPVRGIVIAAPLVALLAVPSWPVQISGSLRVAAVQGNADAGLFAQYPPGTTLDDHLQATVPLFGKRADVVVWPENAADIDPLRSARSAQTLDFVSSQMHAPLIAGTITKDSQGRFFNSLLLWEDGKGAVQQYDKIHPVPFAEYLPDRSFWYPLAPSLFDMVPRDYSFGQRPNVFDINGVKAGVAICFDIVDDSLVHQMIDGGAQLILAPTNNADFGHSDESRQQIAIARLRAIETGRSLVNISTVGMSGMFAPDGSVIDELPDYTAGAMLKNVPLSSTVTPAMTAGRAIEWAVSGFGLAGLASGMVLAGMRRRERRRG